jgi:NAD(P)-dependent dehydrogenase (short-subunit alcohol dehydrogenase family)
MGRPGGPAGEPPPSAGREPRAAPLPDHRRRQRDRPRHRPRRRPSRRRATPDRPRLNVSSAAGLLGLPWHAAYSAAKFGLRGVSEVLRFALRRHRIAVSPEHVAAKIVEGIERDRYLVFTSPDIRLAFLAQRYFPPAYELAMRRLNAHLTAVARSAAS